MENELAFLAVKNEIEVQTADLLATYLEEIASSYEEDDESKLALSISVKLESPKDLDGILVETTLKFVKSRVKESRTGVVNRQQMKLFESAQYQEVPE